MNDFKTYLITGGAGFIGSAVIRQLIVETEATVVNVDKLTYAGNLETLKEVSGNPRYHFEKIDICDSLQVQRLFHQYRPEAVIHLAAESHVDRSIDGPAEFIATNVVGTYTLLDSALKYWNGLESNFKSRFRFHHISTDEVFGSLGDAGFFTEDTPYKPNSPYSATKASSDHLVRAWHHTFGLPVLITNCSNNYGPYQFPEKLIPLMVLNAIEGKALPVYGKGDNVRDWLYVSDHASAIRTVLHNGRIGETYNIGGNNEKTNLEVLQNLCSILDEMLPESPHVPHTSLMTFVKDRPGHDKRYAIDSGKIQRELGWKPKETFETGLKKTVEWYFNNQEWCKCVQKEKYERNRLGLGRKR